MGCIDLNWNVECYLDGSVVSNTKRTDSGSRKMMMLIMTMRCAGT